MLVMGRGRVDVTVLDRIHITFIVSASNRCMTQVSVYPASNRCWWLFFGGDPIDMVVGMFLVVGRGV